MKTIAATRVEATHVVLPQFTNSHGTAFGGQILAWIDTIAAVAAVKHCRLPVITVSMDAIHFIAPIKSGHILILRSQVNAAFRTSLECGVVIYGENPLTGEVHKAAKAYTTFVAIGDDGKPTKIPELILETKEDEAHSAAALVRREHRLKFRNYK